MRLTGSLALVVSAVVVVGLASVPADSAPLASRATTGSTAQPSGEPAGAGPAAPPRLSVRVVARG